MPVDNFNGHFFWPEKQSLFLLQAPGTAMVAV